MGYLRAVAALFAITVSSPPAIAADLIFADGFEPSITCNWASARWLSHGYDGSGYTSTGAWFSCTEGRLSYVQRIIGISPGVFPPAAGTADAEVGCNWGNATRWASEGFDGGAAMTHGATVRCDGTRVTAMAWELTAVPPSAAQPGRLGCNWSGAFFISHGIDGGCAFATGFNVTCSSGRITDFRWVEGCPRLRD